MYELETRLGYSISLSQKTKENKTNKKTDLEEMTQ